MDPIQNEEEECPYTFVAETRGKPFNPVAPVRPVGPDQKSTSSPSPNGFVATLMRMLPGQQDR
ncbi:hypothetical protein M407DRAFT_244679 [Tulasnella calospora MUT 4182]|uniref:Uncharacterized protein n=1 Tax=Tulasnella calospora MUT 4182 TaxID=1051891 RepID=A0A0C3QDM1_9AGAM|nr:hypothetical protein M407DRAFT_244679 [Tulasnella calospora MUT 4182]